MSSELLEPAEENLLGKNVGNYVIESPLKRGGMGAVYIARHPALGRVAAVKFLDADICSPEMSARFLNEARITASLQHRNIIDIFDFGDLGGRFYYVMELLIGQDLGEEMSNGARLPLPTVIDYLSQICAGLAAAHHAGVVHRDLKPANIFVLDGHPLTIKLMDFGIAKILATDTSKTNHGQILGTPAYMAPEQALGEVSQISPQTDIYALGVIAYEMLAGRKPFEHTAPMMQLVAHIHESVPPLRETAPHVPESLAKVVESCLAKDAKLRPATAQILGNALVDSLRASAPHSVRRLDPTAAARSPAATKPTSAAKRPAGAKSPSPSPASQHKQGIILATPLIDEALQVTQREGFAQSTPIPANLQQGLTASVASIANATGSGAEPSVTLNDDDRNILKKLLQRMRRKGDLPAFVANVGDVNKKADFDGKYSAGQLSEAILKDHALTAKLLRIVNTTYLQRFGGKIYSVQQAIVILGFEQIRSIALSIAIFDKAKDGPNGARIADSSVHSLVSGEIAKEFCKLCQLKDTEQAMVCSMFCNLGRHLAIVYLPEQYDKALTRAQADNISLDRAAEKELGLSFQKLGLGVAEQWHLPPQLLQAMTAPPTQGTKLIGDEQRVAALAHLSNDLCELVAEGLSGPQDPKLRKLLAQHENLVAIDPESIPELMANVEENFRVRYASLLGKASRGSKFLQKLPEFSPQSKRRRAAELANTQPLDKSGSQVRATKSDAKASFELKRKIAAPRAVQALKLGQKAVLGDAQTVPHVAVVKPATDSKIQDIEELRAALLDKDRRQEAWEHALEVIAEHLSLPRLVALRANDNGTELVASHAFGQDAQALTSELRFELNPSPTNLDVFSRAFHLKKDVLVKDSFSEKSATQVPARYFEVLGSPAFALLVCCADEHPPTLLLADVEDADTLPSRSQLGSIDELKALLAQAVA